MGESAKHLELVQRLIDCVENIPQIESALIQSDLPDSAEKPTCTIDGFRPDIFYNHRDYMIIGEAKTSFDFDRKHSVQQYLSYYKRCCLFSGKSIFVIAIPWTEHVSVKNLLRRLKMNNGYEIETWIINDMGRVDKL